MHAAEFAAIMKVTHTTMSRWERGQTRPNAADQTGYMLLLRLIRQFADGDGDFTTEAKTAAFEAGVKQADEDHYREMSKAVKDAYQRGQDEALLVLLKDVSLDRDAVMAFLYAFRSVILNSISE